MKALITGCSGFIGSHLADLLVKEGLEVFGITHRGDTRNVDHVKDKINLIKLDITRKEDIKKLLHEIKPDYVFHLAAQSLVTVSWKDPETTLKTNVLGTLYLLDAIREEGIDPIIEVVCSSAEYGTTYENKIPTEENKTLRPTSVYAISKVAEDMLAELYAKSYKMKIIRVRLFSISGPRKVSDFISDFAKGVVEIESGLKENLSVGDLSYIRDVTDVRDAVRALWVLAKNGQVGEVYNVCSGKGYKVRDILNILLSLARKEIPVNEKDPSKLRLMDDPLFIGNNSKIRILGWQPEIPIEETLKDTLGYWRQTLNR